MASAEVFLSKLGDKTLASPIKNGLLRLCPTMDLIAIVNQENQVQIFRLKGELVHAIPKKRPEANITSLAWKPNGQLLAIGFDDGVVHQVNTVTGLVEFLNLLETTVQGICFLGWGMSLIDPVRATGPGLFPESINNLVDSDLDEFKQDLPTMLAHMEVEELLPRLSTIPALNPSDEIFSSKASLKALFHGTSPQDEKSADVMVTGKVGGGIDFEVYNHFHLTEFQLGRNDYILKQYASHPYSSTYAVIYGTQDSGTGPSHLYAIDLRPISDSGKYLPLIASKTSQLLLMMKYLSLVQRQITTEFLNSQDLPKKFMRNIEESLQEKDHCSFVDAAYHLAATGHCSQTMKEWLKDELGDRGHKRWDKAVTSGYENVRQYTHENLLPALQRYTAIMSRLRGLSKFQDSSPGLGLETQEIDQIFDTLNCLEILGHCILIYTGQELQQYHSFGAWLKHEIEFQAIDPTSVPHNEYLERDVIPDYVQLLEYIGGPMQKSQLYELLDLHHETQKETWNMDKEGSGLYEKYKSEIKKLRNGETLDKRLPGLGTMLSHLKEQLTTIFTKISMSQSRTVHVGEMINLGSDIELMDVVMLPVDNGPTPQSMHVYVAQVKNNDRHPLKISRITLNITNGISTAEDFCVATIKLAKDMKVDDVKFADSESLVILFSHGAKSSIMSITYSSDLFEMMEEDDRVMPDFYSIDSEDAKRDAKMPYMLLKDILNSCQHTFPTEDHPWKPSRIQVNGRPERRLICAIAEDNMRYALFDYDSWRHNVAGEEEEEEETHQHSDIDMFDDDDDNDDGS